MTDLPDPLVPAEVDLRDFKFMPLDVGRMLTSETWLLGNGDQCKAAITLWCVSWHQVPAASLPAHAKMLAQLSGAGARWPKVKDHAMRGWIECSDGRLYHPVVAEKAIEAWAHKRKQSARGKAGAAKRWSGDGGSISASNSASNASAMTQAMPTPMLADSKGQGQGQGQDQTGTGQSEGFASGIVSLPNSEFKSLDSGKNTIPERATPGGPSDDDRAAERQGAWFQRAAVEVRLLMSDDEADALIAGALGGDPKAKAQVERIWQNRARGAA